MFAAQVSILVHSKIRTRSYTHTHAHANTLWHRQINTLFPFKQFPVDHAASMLNDRLGYSKIFIFYFDQKELHTLWSRTLDVLLKVFYSVWCLRAVKRITIAKLFGIFHINIFFWFYFIFVSGTRQATSKQCACVCLCEKQFELK